MPRADARLTGLGVSLDRWVGRTTILACRRAARRQRRRRADGQRKASERSHARGNPAATAEASFGSCRVSQDAPSRRQGGKCRRLGVAVCSPEQAWVGTGTSGFWVRKAR